jgi:hypothetical protein
MQNKVFNIEAKTSKAVMMEDNAGTEPTSAVAQYWNDVSWALLAFGHAEEPSLYLKNVFGKRQMSAKLATAATSTWRLVQHSVEESHQRRRRHLYSSLNSSWHQTK